MTVQISLEELEANKALASNRRQFGKVHFIFSNLPVIRYVQARRVAITA